ncbi:hypothetical protein ACQPW3_10750 [Actinosynnema sp. CA-248983]
MTSDGKAGVDHQAALSQCAAEYREAQARLSDAREALNGAIRAADADGMKQADIIRATGHVWTREQVRQVLRAGQG